MSRNNLFIDIPSLYENYYAEGKMYKLKTGGQTFYFKIDAFVSSYLFIDFPSNISFYDSHKIEVFNANISYQDKYFEAYGRGDYIPMPISVSIKNMQWQTVITETINYKTQSFYKNGYLISIPVVDTMQIKDSSNNTVFSLKCNYKGTNSIYSFELKSYVITNSLGVEVAEFSTSGKKLWGNIDSIPDYSQALFNGDFNAEKYSYNSATLKDSQYFLQLMGSKNINGYGNATDNVIIGNNGRNILNGLGGRDDLAGGKGNDIYYYDGTDMITEYYKQGTDTIITSANNTYLGDNIENLELLENVVSGAGNNLRNLIKGNASNNELDGKEGADTLIGYLGDDTYIIDNKKDIIKENKNQGIDTVKSSIDYKLGANLENLILTVDAYKAVGNKLDNIITGNNSYNELYGDAGNDIIYGKDGNDIIVGGRGFDTLSGDAGDDVYKFSLNHNFDNINDVAGSNTIYFDKTVNYKKIAIYQVDSDTIQIDYGTKTGKDVITFDGWNANVDTLQTIQVNKKFISRSEINAIIQNMTQFATDHGFALNSINDVKNNKDLMTLISTAWHN